MPGQLTSSSSKRKALLLTCIIFFFLLLPAWWATGSWYKNRLLTEERSNYSIDLGFHGNALSAAIHKRFALLDGLYAFTLSHPSPQDLDHNFSSFARGLHAGSRGIRNFAVAPGGVQRYVYPLKGNEKVPGHDLINDKRPNVRTDVQRAVSLRQTALSGPYKLRQGGLGLVARRAVFAEDSLWGLVTMVIDMPPVFEEAGIFDSKLALDIAVLNKSGGIIQGAESILNNNPVTIRIELPEDHWDLAGVPRSGWGATISQYYLIYKIYSILILGLLAALSYMIIVYQAHLKSTVYERTVALERTNLQLTEKIEDLRKTRIELHASREQFRTMVESIPGTVYRCELVHPWRVEFISEGVMQLTGYSSDDFINGKMNLGDFILPEDQEHVSEIVEEGIQNKKSFVIEYRYQNMDGSILWVYEKGRATYDSDGKALFIDGVILDITERKKLESQLLQAQKIEAVGQLAGGVAHEFNNILTAINNNIFLALKKTQDSDVVKPKLETVLQLSDNAAKIARELLAFSREQYVELSPIKLNDATSNAGRLVANFIGDDIALTLRLTPSNPSIMANQHQIEQVIMNIATNARDAMPDGGIFELETSIVSVDDNFIKAQGTGKPGTYALLSAADSGQGIPEDIKQRIFDPFFTTRETGKGTGLGLSIVFGIVSQHNGFITVSDNQEAGTIFKIYFPQITSKAAPKEAVVAALAQGSGETILLAEDETSVRESMKLLLEESGYKVIEAVNGKDAISEFNTHKDLIALLIFDVIMPELNGKDAFKEIKQTSPEAKVLFISGYTSDIMRRKGVLDDGLPFVSKPVPPEHLLARVRELLNA